MNNLKSHEGKEIVKGMIFPVIVGLKDYFK